MRFSTVQVWLGFLLALALASPARADTRAETQEHAWIGIQFRYVELTPSPATDGLSSGLRVDLALPGAPAAVAGLRPDDVILYVNGKPTPKLVDYFNALGDASAGAVVPFVLIRGHQRLSVDVRLKARPSDYGSLWSDYARQCISSGHQSTADAARRHDYRTAFQEDLTVLRCASLEGNTPAAVSAWDAGMVQLAEILPKLRPAPPVPHEAERHNQRAVAILKDAAGDDDIDKASNEFGWALYEAPWLPDLYLNYALTLEKAGYPEAAIGELRRYLLLKPNGGDADQVKQKIAELEVLAEERKPWLPFATPFPIADGSSGSVTLRGRKLVIRVVNHADQGQSAEAGDDIFLSATIHGNRLEGKAFVHPHAPLTEPFSRKDPDGWIRCFGSGVMALDAEGEIQPGGTQFRVRVKEPSYNTQSCAVVDHAWQPELTFNASNARAAQ